MDTAILWILLVLCLLMAAALIAMGIQLRRLSRRPEEDGMFAQLQGVFSAFQQSSGRSVEQMGEMLRREQTLAFSSQEEKLSLLGNQISRQLGDSAQSSDRILRQTEERLRTFSTENEQKLSAIRETLRRSLQQMQEEQSRQLTDMRQVVDEKMQKVLDERMKQAFSAVNERLEQVYKGLGEMQSLAAGVGDLKKLLTNVKTRGEIGEIQLDALLSDMLAQEQFVRNARLGTGVVEFAVRMPDSGGGEVLLPIDAKFAGDTYLHLQDAYESGDQTAIAAAQKALIRRIRSEAQDIAGKYIVPPKTTDFGILFLPTEGLYAEAVRAGLPDELFRKYRVFVTGPTTIAAMLSTLRMGFQSIAVQQYSTQVFQLLGEVRTEFHKFTAVLARTQEKLGSASDELEKLVGVRARQMERKLNDVQVYLTNQDA